MRMTVITEQVRVAIGEILPRISNENGHRMSYWGCLSDDGHRMEMAIDEVELFTKQTKNTKKSCKHANSAQRDNETQTAGEPGGFASIYAFSGNFRRSICKTVRFVNGFETL